MKFSHTNRKHFTVGDPMAFPIVKIGNKNPKTSLLLARRGPHLIQQYLGLPQAPPQTAAAPTVEVLSHTYTVKSPLVTMARSKSTPSRGPIPKPHYVPHPWTRPTYDVKQHLDGSDPPFFHNALDRPTHRQTDRSST